MVIAANTRISDKFPSVFLHKHDGTGQSSKHSILHPGDKIRQFSAPTKFQLIPLTASGDILCMEEGFGSRSSFWKEFKRWKHVAIRCEKKEAFLSCSRKASIIPAGYKSTIGVSERFELTHFPATESFSFRSHNGLYLSHNRTLGSIVFRAESKREGATIASHRAWEITPVLGFASTDPRIKFVGAIDSLKRVVMKLQPDEMKIDGGRNTNVANVTKHEDKNKDKSIEYMSHATSFVTGGGLRHGECTHFRTPSGDFHYYVRDKRGTVFLIVVAEGFSRALAGECLNELCAIHKKLDAGKHKHHHPPIVLLNKTTSEQLKSRTLLEHELRFLVWNYNEHNEAFRHHPLRNQICNDLEDAIDTVLDYKGNRLALQRRVKQLNHTADAFRATMRHLRARQVSKWVVAGAVGGGSVGALVGASVGMAMGGPAGAAFVGAQAAKVGAIVAGSGASVGVALQQTIAPLMWKKHVHHSSPPPPPPSYKLLYQYALARYK